MGQFPGPTSLRPETVGQSDDIHGRHVAQSVQTELAQFIPDFVRNGQQVHRLGRQETGRIWRRFCRPQGLAGTGGDVSGKLSVSHAGPGRQVLGHCVQQGRYQAGLAAVQGFQSVQAHVGRAKLRPLYPVADSLQGQEHPVENPPVGGLVRFQHYPVILAGQSLLQGHSVDYARGGGEMVDDQGPALRAVNYESGLVLQVGLPSHLHLGPKVGNQDAGDFHAASSRIEEPGTGGNQGLPCPVGTMLRADPGFRVRQLLCSRGRRL